MAKSIIINSNAQIKIDQISSYLSPLNFVQIKFPSEILFFF